MVANDKLSSQSSRKPFNVLGALSDLLILALLVGGAGFGGYFLGIQQRLAPVVAVPPGTAGALPAQSASSPLTPALPPAKTSESATAGSNQNTVSGKASAGEKQTSKTKYWLSSSGDDYTGYSVTVSVNGTAIDNFFGPGKNVDVTRHVVAGDNTVLFEAKALGDQYNKHKGDEQAILTVQLVSGPQLREDFKPTDVLLGFSRNAAENQDFKDTQHFVKE